MQNYSPQKRLFIAIPLSSKMRKMIIDVQKELKQQGLSCIKPENLHITICFLGDVDESSFAVLNKKLKEVSQKIYAFHLFPVKIKCMPQKNPRMIWLEFKKNKEFSDLVKKIQTEVKKIYPTLEFTSQKIIPHITLSRFKSSKNKPFLPYLIATQNEKFNFGKVGTVKISSCQLMISRLQVGGSVYAVIYRYRFKS